MLINTELLDDLAIQAKVNPRLRLSYDRTMNETVKNDETILPLLMEQVEDKIVTVRDQQGRLYV